MVVVVVAVEGKDFVNTDGLGGRCILLAWNELLDGPIIRRPGATVPRPNNAAL
jgi:hypothetical protein